MKTKRAVQSALIVATCATALTAQRTWIVDRKNGPGADFVDLPPALASARDGDTIRIRAGFYSRSRTGKALRILGEGNVSALGLEISGLPVGKTITVRNIALSTLKAPANGLLSITGNGGHVVLDGVRSEVPTLGLDSTRRPAAVVTNSGAVSMNHCTFRGAPGLACSRSTLLLSSSQVDGEVANLASDRVRRICTVRKPAFPAAEVQDSTVLITDTRLTGGNGASEFAGYCFGAMPPAEGMRLRATKLVLAGSSSVVAPSFSSLTAAAIADQGGSEILYDPRVSISGTPRFSGTPKTWSRRLPALTANATSLAVASTLHSPRGHIGVLMIATLGPPTRTPLGQLWLNPATVFVADVGIQDSSELRRVVTPLPRDPALLGLALGLQSISGTGSSFDLSTPVAVVLN